MSANFKSGFMVRVPAWHGLGEIVKEAPTSLDALHLAGLDWDVVQSPVFVNNREVDNYKANVRSSDNSVLGIVSDRYEIVQNKEAFDFTDSLIGGDVHYETAGSLRNGKTIWLLAQLPSTTILGDDVEQYLCFTNSHDGKGAVKCFCTPIRVVCQNTLNMAMNSAKRSWSFKHMGDLESKLNEARQTLEFADKYMKELQKEAEELATKTISDMQIMTMVKTLFPVSEDMTARQIKSMEYNKEALLSCFKAPDIANFKNTAWGAVNALSDFVSHTEPLRNTNTFAERRFESVVSGNTVFDTGIEMLRAM